MIAVRGETVEAYPLEGGALPSQVRWRFAGSSGVWPTRPAEALRDQEGLGDGEKPRFAGI
jgi:hypothetical protein